METIPAETAQSPNTDNGVPRESPAGSGYTVSYMGKTLLSTVDPVGHAVRLAERFPVKENTLYFCPSPLYGYGLELFLSRLSRDSAVLCAEADGRLFELSVKHMAGILRGGGDSIRLVKTGEKSGGELCSFVNKTWGRRRFRRVEVISFTGGSRLFPEIYENLAADLERDMALSWGNAMTLIKLGRLYSRNMIRNLPLLSGSKPVSAINYGNDPVLLLGAGPSLDIILGELELYFGESLREPGARNFRIICADTALLPLKDRNIRPDLAVILESQHWNLRDFTGARAWGIPAALDLSALPASSRVLGGELYLFSTPWTELRLFKRLEENSLLPPLSTPLGSVGLSAAELALRLTKGPVVTGGIDFSFTPDAYHARSTPGHKALLSSQNRFNSVLNASAAFRNGTFSIFSKSNLPVRSDPAMRNYRELFEEEFSRLGRIFEIAGPGLHLGCSVLSPGQAAETLSLRIGAAKTESGAFSVAQKTIEKNKLVNFLKLEKEKLLRLKAALTGTPPSFGAKAGGETEKLVDDCDYLWAHFPETAGAGGRRPPVEDISFLKRVRTEIEPFVKLWDFALKETESQAP